MSFEFAFVALIGGLIIGALVKIWTWSGEYTARDHVGVKNAELY